MPEPSAALSFIATRLQEIALIIMALTYIVRLTWFLTRFKPGGERQAPSGSKDTNAQRGAVYSLANVAMPWSMESTRKHMFFYLQFILFHVAAVTSITMSIVIPYLPWLTRGTVLAPILQVLFAIGCLIGLGRFIRRIASPYMRAISTPDDFFSIGVLTVWMFFAVLAAPYNIANGEWHMMTYFLLTAFFVLYVPYSKISHYLYYPFTRWYFGKTLGHRGVYPLKYDAPPPGKKTREPVEAQK
ncbi:MAG: hypothetical protein ACYS8W_04515 [Planctomycetota bacterium]|jgi:hypothetical protein